MIESISQLLEEFRRVSLETIKREDADIKHTVAIGDNFEGLTSEILGKAIFEGLDLRIVERSFIYNDSGDVSDEFDCLLVVGEGIKMSFTDRYKYHIKNVIAVIQVKKSLYAKDIDDAHNNLRSVIEVSEPRDGDEAMARMFRDSYKLLVGKDLPNEERRKRFTDRENIVYHYSMMEAFHPPRIVIGYYGYKDEFALREGFITKMEKIVENGPKRGYSPGSFPSLFLCGNLSIVKNNGIPMGYPLQFDEDFYFPVLFTSVNNSMYHLLEIIWTRLVYKFRLSSEIFGDDYDLEAMHPFLWGKERQMSEDWGWEFYYHYLPKDELEKPLIPIKYKPAEINKDQFIVLKVVSEKGEIDVETDKEFNDYINQNGIDKKEFLDKLNETRLTYIDEGKLRVMVDTINYVFSPDGKIYAGENRSGEMSKYFAGEMIEKKK